MERFQNTLFNYSKKHNNVVNICQNRLGEAILTNVHKICWLKEKDYLLSLILSFPGLFIQRKTVYKVKVGTNTVVITRVLCNANGRGRFFRQS